MLARRCTGILTLSTVKIREQHNAAHARLRAWALLLCGAFGLLWTFTPPSAPSPAPTGAPGSGGATASARRDLEGSATSFPRSTTRIIVQGEGPRPAEHGADSPRDIHAEEEPTAAPEPTYPGTWSNRDLLPPAFGLDPRDLRVLEDLIDANGLGVASSSDDPDDGDGVFGPLEFGAQRWRNGRLVALLTGADRYGSFGYALTELPESLGNLDALEELDLGSNRLREIPDSLGRLHALRTLRLHRNGIAVLPSSVSSLRSLRELSVGENQLRALPSGVGTLAALEELHANDNPLEVIPESIGLLRALRVLNVSRGPVADAARSSDSSADWNSRSARAGGLDALPRSLEALTALDTLHVAGNRLYCAGGLADPGRVPDAFRNGRVARVHGLLAQHCDAPP